MTPALLQEFRRIAPRLVRAGSFLAVQDKTQFGLFIARNKARRPVVKIDTQIVMAWQKHDLLDGDQHKFVLSKAGHALWRRLNANGDKFRAQHQIIQNVKIDDDHRNVKKNMSETPLAWLRARNHQSGVSITDIEFDAGERLREDFDAAQLNARLTVDLTQAVSSKGRRITNREIVPLNALDARKRLQQALQYAGPGLADMLLMTCCELCGIEESEKRFGWPRRSGKLMLKMGLARLAVFYGLQTDEAASESLRMR